MTDKEKERLEELQVHLWNAYELINDILDEYSEGEENETRLIPKKIVNKKTEMEITRYLQRIGISPLGKGYGYLREAIKMAIKDPSVCVNLAKRIYPQIANANNTTPKGVEKAIDHAIKSCFKKEKQSKFAQDVFGYIMEDPQYVPSSGEFIIIIADRIKMQNR